MNQTIVRRARADRNKVGDWIKSLCRLLATLESYPLDDSRVAADKEKVMKCARAIETANQKKRALELAQQRKLQVYVLSINSERVHFHYSLMMTTNDTELTD